MFLAECVNRPDDSRLAPAVLKQDTWASPWSPRAEWRRLLPLQFDEFHGDLFVAEQKSVAVVSTMLD